MLTMRGGSQVGNNGVKMARPPPVPPRPDRSLVADALAKSRKVPAPVLPPGLKKELASKKTDSQPSPSDSSKSTNNKLPSPKLNGLSRVKSFIRDVMNEKKNSDDKRNSKDKDDNNKNGVLKSQIPIPQSQSSPKIKSNDPPSLNYIQEDSTKNQSNQSVVRSLCGVLMNSEKDKSHENNSNPIERVRVVKSNSFAEKPVPARRAPPPPISPKPSKKLIEDRLRSQNLSEFLSIRKLSVSCEELNNPSSRPVVYQSSVSNKMSSPMLTKKNIPPTLPSGKPPIFAKKKSITNSPTGSATNSLEVFSFIEKSNSVEKLNAAENIKPTNQDNFSSMKFCDEKESLSQKLISEIISAKNDALLYQYRSNQNLKNNDSTREEVQENSLTAKSHHELQSANGPNDDPGNKTNVLRTEERVKCVNISYNGNSSPNNHDNSSTCGSDSSSSGASKTVLFINSDAVSQNSTQHSNANSPVQSFSVKMEKNENTENHKNRLNDIANHELLISELQDMRREAFEGQINKRQRKPSLELNPPSPDSISGETQNIQHSDWEQVEGDGQRVRYSSCQIVIEDPSSPVDDSGICLDDNFYSGDSSFSLSPSLVSRLKEQYYANLKMSSLQGLPPLPKSLSGFNMSEGGPPQGQPPPPPVPARSAASFRYGAQGARAGSASPPVLNGTNESHRQTRKPTTLDTQLAVLKREMLSLRQLDLSLLSQLWSLNESIHEFRQYMAAPGVGGGPGGGPGDGDLEDDGDDSSSGGEDPRPPPQRGRTPL